MEAQDLLWLTLYYKPPNSTTYTVITMPFNGCFDYSRSAIVKVTNPMAAQDFPWLTLY